MKRTFSAPQSAEFGRRHDALVRSLRAGGFEHFVATATESIFYLTGATFEPLERPFFLVVGADGSRRTLVPMLELDHLGKAWGVDAGSVSTYREFPAPQGEGWLDHLLRMRIEGAFAFDDNTPCNVADALRKAGGTAADLLEPIRLVKSGLEIAQIEQAARYADWGVHEVLRRAWNGASVAETYMPTQALQRKIIREVSDWDALATKVIAGAWPAPLSAEPHSVPRVTDRLGPGPHVAMVLTRVNGYAAENERTFFTAAPSSRERELFQTMQRAREVAFALVRPGVACTQIDAEVNQFLQKAGFVK